MRRISLVFVVAAVAASMLGIPAPSVASVTRTPVSFQVVNPVGGETLTVHGGLYRDLAAFDECASVLLLVHGLSYGEFGWDLPGYPQYSTARALAAAGYANVAIDLPGYESAQPDTQPKPDGYSLTVQAYAHMIGQIEKQLRSGAYTGGPAFSDVGLVGHSAGTEITELALGHGFADAEVYIPTGYTHIPSQRIAMDFFTGDYVRAATDDYEYFGGTEAGRTEYMYALPPSTVVDANVVAADNALANLTPSGEVFSIGAQPSKYVMGLIDVPVLLVLAEKDLLFPIEWGATELSFFASSPSATLYTVPAAGHSFMLHTNAPATFSAIAGWLATQPIAACSAD